MSSPHLIENAKTSSARCSSTAPCQGAPIQAGELRYGRLLQGQYGTQVQWHHWRCVTPQMKADIAAYGLDRIPRIDELTPADQRKITFGLANRNMVVQSSAARSVASTSTPTGSKRKATFDSTGQGHSAGSQSQAHSIDYEQAAAQAPNSQEAREELYITMNTKIVGIQHYIGLVGRNEQVILVREPHNRFDSNAIQVKNASRIQIGHIPKEIARCLAPLLDRKQVTVEGVMHEGNIGVTAKLYSLGMSLKFYGDPSQRDTLEPLLRFATPGGRGFPPRATTTSTHQIPGMPSNQGSGYPNSQPPQGNVQAQSKEARARLEAIQKAADLRQMLASMEQVNDAGRRASLMDDVCSSEDILSLPLHPKPPGIASGELKVDLLKHQSQALAWCIQRENPVMPQRETDPPVQFWKLATSGTKKYYFNIVTQTPIAITSRPRLGRGAICADDMGLGKTMTMLGLIIATKAEKPGPNFANTTLIVAPVSVVSNWVKQIEDHCTPGTLTSCVYHGSSAKSMSSQDLQKYDVVITTYGTLASEHVETPEGSSQPVSKKRKTGSSLFDVNWKRIILDEGHNIRNPSTKVAKATFAVTAERRWVLSGTPIINSPKDLRTLLTFLQICQPLDDPDYFKRSLLRPLKAADPAGVELLKALMSHICIRRTKEMQDSNGQPLVPLPPVEVTVVPVTLHPEAQALYDELETLSKERIEDLMETGQTSLIQSNMLSMLTRMRQAVLHPALVPSSYLEQLRTPLNTGSSAPGKPLTPEEKARLQSLLLQLIEDCEECPICLSSLDDPRITPCAHAFCLSCITNCLANDARCPMDRGALAASQLVEPPPPTELTQKPWSANEDEEPAEGRSAKVEQLIKLLELTPGGEKSLVFSQFTSFLDKIGDALTEAGIPYVRFDGKMSAKRRTEVITQFSVPVAQTSKTLKATAEKPSQDLATSSAIVGEDSGRRRSSRHSAAKAAVTVEGTDVSGSEFEPDHGGDDDDDDDDFASSPMRQKGKARMQDQEDDFDLHFDEDAEQNPRVMLISLKAGALGLNLTVANNVYLMDPWWQEGIESQAIDRCNRIGQTKPVHVHQLIAENTVEAKVIDIQDKKKKLIQEAFSGTKRRETVREKKQARLQELVELFGVRLSASQVSA